MKRFLLIVSLFAVYALSIQVVLPGYVDPFNVFHWKHIRNLPTEPNKNYIKMRYLLDNPERFDGFMFGSSRVGVIHTDKIPEYRVYNMTYSMGVPHEHLDNIRTMLDGGVTISMIYIGLDSVSITESPASHISQPLRCPYEYLRDNPEHLYALYLSPIVGIRSLGIILNAEDRQYIDVDEFYAYGYWGKYGTKSKYNWDGLKYTKTDIDDELKANRVRNVLKDISMIIELCRQNNIKLVLFTNPMHKVMHLKSFDEGYIEFLEGLADISDFYNFSGLNDITLNNENYIDGAHYKAEVGDMILNVICSGEVYPKLYEQVFGVKVTRDNAREFIDMLRAQAETQ